MLIVMGQTGNRTLQSKAESDLASVGDDETPSECKCLVEVLSELRKLLEDYSPSWYTEEHHRRVELALHNGKKH
jgi:hypothetical protein